MEEKHSLIKILCKVIIVSAYSTQKYLYKYNHNETR